MKLFYPTVNYSTRHRVSDHMLPHEAIYTCLLFMTCHYRRIFPRNELSSTNMHRGSLFHLIRRTEVDHMISYCNMRRH